MIHQQEKNLKLQAMNMFPSFNRKKNKISKTNRSWINKNVLDLY